MPNELDELFVTHSWQENTAIAVEQAEMEVESISDEDFDSQSDDEIAKGVCSRHQLEPLAINEEAATHQRRSVKRHIEDPFEALTSKSPRALGTELLVFVPFTGAIGLWKMKLGFTAGYLQVRVFGNIESDADGNWLVLKIFRSDKHDPDAYKRDLDEKLASIRNCLKASAAQVAKHNAEIDRAVSAAIGNRRSRHKKQNEISALLKIPLRRRDGAPPIAPVKLQPRWDTPVHRSTEKREYKVADSDYEVILKIIRLEGRTGETTPCTFRSLDEEDLRNLLLAHLNGHFEGDAAGEVFRRKGKTDIHIEFENKSAFIAECKLWHGEAEIGRAIDQLLGYLVWRDSKAALIIWNKSARAFTSLLPKLHDALTQHVQFVDEQAAGQSGEFRVRMRTSADALHIVTLSVFLFNLFCPDQN